MTLFSVEPDDNQEILSVCQEALGFFTNNECSNALWVEALLRESIALAKDHSQEKRMAFANSMKTALMETVAISVTALAQCLSKILPIYRRFEEDPTFILSSRYADAQNALKNIEKSGR